MTSFRRYQRPVDIVAEMRMERQVHRKSFILVEGSTDIDRFQKFFDGTRSSFVNCYGRENVEGAIEIEENSAREDSLGFVDKDFDVLFDNCVASDAILCSNTHDFDTDVYQTDALRRYIEEVAVVERVADSGGLAQCLLSLLVALKPLSAARYASVRYGLTYSFASIQHHEFFDGESIDLEALVGHLSQGSLKSPEHRENLRQHIKQFVDSNVDLWQITNGHDLSAGLGIALRKKLGDRSISQTRRSAVESHLRSVFDDRDFEQLGFFAKVQEWEASRPGRQVLKR